VPESVRTEKKRLLWSVKKRSWTVLLLWYECAVLLRCFCGTCMSPTVVKILTVKAGADTDFHLRGLNMGKVIDIKKN